MTPKQIIEAIKAERPEINTLFFVGCGASSAEQYPAQYFMDCNARKIRTSFYTANEFNYATPVSLDETAIVIACSLGGTTPETVAAAKLSQEKGAKVIAVTHDGNSPLAKNADYVIVHGFEKDYAAKLEKMNNILMLAVEVLNQYEGYDHYEDIRFISSIISSFGISPQEIAAISMYGQTFFRYSSSYLFEKSNDTNPEALRISGSDSST